MAKVIITLVAVLALAGCATTPKLTCNVKPVAVPIVYSPAPPVVARPVLPITTITKTDSDGVVVKKYAASVQALLGYSKQLEDIINQYQNIHNSYGALSSQVASDWKAKTGTDLQVPPPPNTQITTKP